MSPTQAAVRRGAMGAGGEQKAKKARKPHKPHPRRYVDDDERVHHVSVREIPGDDEAPGGYEVVDLAPDGSEEIVETVVVEEQASAAAIAADYAAQMRKWGEGNRVTHPAGCEDASDALLLAAVRKRLAARKHLGAAR